MTFWGQFALHVALIAAFLQVLSGVLGYRVSKVLAHMQATFIAFAFVMLIAAFIQNDFSLLYVAKNSHEQLPLMYRATAVWGAHEGSMLLLVLVLQIWMIAFDRTHASPPLKTMVRMIYGMLTALFLLFLLFTSNPFLAAAEPSLGEDLNPLLQDPGFILHPPFLFMGYVGFSSVFAIALAALLVGMERREVGGASHAFRLARQFALAAWLFLTIGIFLGAWWAYRVLGFGGFWFWDPVENASLLPWLLGVALIHLLLLAETSPRVRPLALILSLMTFLLSVLGTFLVRSGVLISVHAFAEDPSRGIFLLLLLGVLVFVAWVVYLWRVPFFTAKSDAFQFGSRASWLLLASITWSVVTMTVLLGTLYPLIADWLYGHVVSVGAPYFQSVLWPLIAMLLFMMILQAILVMGSSPIAWRRTLLTVGLYLFLTGMTVCSVMAISMPLFSLSACFLLTLALVLFMGFYQTFQQKKAMTLAHAGFAFLIISLILHSAFSLERTVALRVDESAMLGPYRFKLQSVKSMQGENYKGVEATIFVRKQFRDIASLHPQKRIYPVRDMIMSKVDIEPGVFRDLYVALGDPINDQTWTVRLYYKPFVSWMMFAVLIMLLGGGMALWQTRSKRLR